MIGVAMLNEFVFMAIGMYFGWKIRGPIFWATLKMNEMFKRSR